jgi:hypothetical protein
MKRLRANLTAMMGCIEVSLDRSFAVSFGDHSLLTLCSLQNLMKVSEQHRRQLVEMASELEENKGLQVSVTDLQVHIL